MEQECFDVDAVAVRRAAACLNLRRWREAFDAAAHAATVRPEEDLVAAFAAFELADHDEALARWLHAAIQRPRAAHMLIDADVASGPKTFEAVEDHPAGVDLVRSLGAYRKRQPARRFFATILRAEEARALVQEHEAAQKAMQERLGDLRPARPAALARVRTRPGPAAEAPARELSTAVARPIAAALRARLSCGPARARRWLEHGLFTRCLLGAGRKWLPLMNTVRTWCAHPSLAIRQQFATMDAMKRFVPDLGMSLAHGDGWREG